MTNDTKDLLMQYLQRIAGHYEIDNAAQISFRQRDVILESLKSKAPAAFAVMDRLITAFIKEDRITNDKEKYDKARTLWESEHAAAEHDKVEAEKLLIDFLKSEHIPVGKVLA